MSDLTAPIWPPSFQIQEPTPEQRLRQQQVLQEARRKLKEGYDKVEMDGDKVIFVIGGEKIAIPPLTFYSLKKCWEVMGVAATTPDIVNRIDSVLQVLEAALEVTDKPRTLEELSKGLRGHEWPGLTASYGKLMVQSGLLTEEELLPKEPEPGEAQGGGAGSNPSSNGKADPYKTNMTASREGPTSIQ